MKAAAAGSVGGPGNGAEKTKKRPEAGGNIGRALLHTRAMLALPSAPRALTAGNG